MRIEDIDQDPINEFQKWFDIAKMTNLPHPNAMTLATATKIGYPSARVVLLKDIEEGNFVFYTNYNSRKSGELDDNPRAALVFHWDILRRQIRIEGIVEKVSQEKSKLYFQSRPKESCLAAWASKQSEVIESREVLESEVVELREKYRDQELIPLPSFWGGFQVIPHSIEFWEEGSGRLHDRFRYSKEDSGQWLLERLAP